METIETVAESYGKVKIILSTIVGSRLHGTHTEKSDTDYRGVFIAPIADILSPFRNVKDTHWVEGADKADSDDTAYELTKFCKMCAQGNPSCLEVLVGLPHTTTELGEELKKLLPAFISKKRCFDAFMGYARNQEKKFRDCGSVRESSGASDRKHKYACAHIRTLYQLAHLLKHNELIGRYPSLVTQQLIEVKNGRTTDQRIMNAVLSLEEECHKLYDKSEVQESPDIDAIENFILSAYLNG